MTGTVKVDKRGVKLIAHRGLSGLYLENTLAAFEEAGKRSYYGIETDVHRTADGKFILVHDDDLKRIAGVNRKVEKSTLADLRTVRLKDEKNGLDAYLPTPNEYFVVCKKYGKQAIFELKNPLPKSALSELIGEVRKTGWFARTTFISFSKKNLLYLRELAPDADAQFLSECCKKKEIKFMVENRLDADLHLDCVTEEGVSALHKAGLKVNVWTVDEPKRMQELVSYGVDFVTTNILE